MFEYIPLYCTLCDQVTKDRSHVIRCPHCPVRADIRTKFKRDFICLLLDTSTHSTTIRVLTYTINAWLNMALLLQLRDLASEASTNIQGAYEFQRQIRWEQFLKGRLHIGGKMYNHTQTHTNTTHPMDAEKWGSKINSLIWDFVHNMWFTWNNTKNILENSSTDIKKWKLIERIVWINSKMSPTIKHPYQGSTAQILSSFPVSYLNIMAEQLQSYIPPILAQSGDLCGHLTWRNALIQKTLPIPSTLEWDHP
jgi:hypothetical protein